MTKTTHTPTQTTPLPGLFDAAKHLLIDELHRRLGEEGYTTIRESHGCVFRFIDAEGSRLTDLAERARLTKQAVGEVVDELQELGYVERAPHPADGRAKIIRLTDLGQEGQAAARRIFAEIERELAARYGERRVATLRQVLEEIAEDGIGPARPEAAAVA
ncbi:MAG TPA: MarR family transcriptional regulator [Solirubrobacterales bacterium]|nr:MarR family transcriptional regulator [Solirubrobacterales bacterium]